MKHNSKAGARQRIMDAAGEIFARCGYRKATVRDICAKAGVNLAAVNYHFGDKEHLYLETLRNLTAESFQKFPADMGTNRKDKPAVRLRAFIRAFLLRALDQGRPSWFGRILAREMIEPTPILESVMEEIIYPNFLVLSSIVKELLGETDDDESVRLCAASIVGQCLYFGNRRSAYAHFNDSEIAPEEVERITDHITQFSLSALKALSKNLKGNKDGLS